MHVIKHKINTGYYNEHYQSWTTLDRCTRNVKEAMQKVKDKLERSPKYYEKLEILAVEDCPENVRL